MRGWDWERATYSRPSGGSMGEMEFEWEISWLLPDGSKNLPLSWQHQEAVLAPLAQCGGPYSPPLMSMMVLNLPTFSFPFLSLLLLSHAGVPQRKGRKTLKGSKGGKEMEGGNSPYWTQGLVLPPSWNDNQGAFTWKLLAATPHFPFKNSLKEHFKNLIWRWNRMAVGRVELQMRMASSKSDTKEYFQQISLMHNKIKYIDTFLQSS